ncbi:Uncharacterised protein [Collinsella intestinalis]|nr:Uncharacterised protein [Collinsella intestinalis]
MAACDELHLLHHEEVVIHRGVELGVDGRELMLAGRDLVVLGLGRDAERPQLVVEVLHVGRDGGADSAEVVFLELLSLARGGAEEGAPADHEVAAAVGVLLDEEVLLLVPDARNDLLGRLAEEGEHALGLLVQRRHRAQQRGLLVERLARVGAKRGGDAQDVVLDERRARGVPGGVAAGLERGAQAAVGEARRVGLALDQGFAGKLGNGGAVVVGLEEAVVLLARDARERLEPVGVVGGALGDCPLLHGVGHGVGHVEVERLAFLDGRRELLVHVLGEPLLHDVFGEDHRAVSLSQISHTRLLHIAPPATGGVRSKHHGWYGRLVATVFRNARATKTQTN